MNQFLGRTMELAKTPDRNSKVASGWFEFTDCRNARYTTEDRDKRWKKERSTLMNSITEMSKLLNDDSRIYEICKNMCSS